MKRRFGSFFYQRAPKLAAPAVPRWHALTFIKTLVRRTCMTLGGLMLFSIFVSLIASFFVHEKNALPDDMILSYTITDPITETPVSPSFAAPFSKGGMTASDIIASLDRASRDKRVRGFIVNLDNAQFELVHIQELRAAVKRFRAAGKFAHVYTSSFGDLGSGIGAYYFAAAFDEIWMQPVGFLTLTGLAIDMPFGKEALDKIGVNPQFLHREEYKTAMEGLTNAHMSPENREMMASIVSSLSGTLLKDIAQDRKMKESAFQAQLDKGILTGDDAVKAGLINHLEYNDRMVDRVRATVTGLKDNKNPPMVAFEEYAAATVPPAGKHTPVALVTISGEIVSGLEYEAGVATGDYLADAIMDAAENPALKSIVLRVNSPGGSPTASETIRRSIVYAKEKGKKIIVSMGPLAASGGYWVTVDADKIYAMPGTLTGSIGVIMGKFDLSGLWDKLGVNWESVTWGERAKLWSSNRPMDAADRAALDHAIDDTYASFISRVAEGRKMKPEDVRKIAKGRAWTGLQAKDNGLVDEIGGLDDALDEASRIAGFKDRSQIDILVLPKEPSPFEMLRKMMGVQASAMLPETMARMLGLPLASAVRMIETVNRVGPVQVYDPSLPVIRP